MYSISENILVLLLILNSLKSVFSINLHSSIYPQEDKKILFLLWVPQGAYDRSQIEISGVLNQTFNLQPEHSPMKIKEILGDDFSPLAEKLGIKDETEFSERVRNADPTLLYLSIFEKKLAKIMGCSARVTIPTNIKGKLHVNLSILRGEQILDKTVIQIMTNNITKVQPPISIKANPFDQTVQILWNKPKGDEIVAYNVYLSATKKGSFTRHNKKPITIFTSDEKQKNSEKLQASYMISGLLNGKKYCIYITSVHLNSYESAPGKILEVTPVKDDTYPPPQIIKISQNEFQNTAVINWEKSSRIESNYYHIYRSEKMTGPYKRITKTVIPGEFSSFSDSGPFEYGKTYWYRMTAMGSKFKEGPSGAAVYFQPIKRIPPGRIYIKEIQRLPGELKIKITPLSDSDISSYEIFRASDTSSVPSLIGTLKPTLLQFRDKNLDARSIYCYIVRARDKFGNLGETNKPLCNSPENNKILPAPFNVTVYNDQGGLVIEWQYSDHELLTGFQIYRNDNIKNKKFTRINPELLSPGVRHFTDISIIPAKDYAYYIVPVGTNQISGKKSAIVPIRTKMRKSLPIHNLQFFRTDKKVIFSWNQVKKGIVYSIQISDIQKKKIFNKGKVMNERYDWNYKAGQYIVEITASAGNDTYKTFKQINLE